MQIYAIFYMYAFMDLRANNNLAYSNIYLLIYSFIYSFIYLKHFQKGRIQHTRLYISFPFLSHQIIHIDPFVCLKNLQ